MKTRYSTLLTTLAFLGFSISVLAAPPDRCEPWPQCKDDDGGGGTQLFVAVKSDPDLSSPSSPLYAPADLDPNCLAIPNRSFTAVFPRHDLCATLTTSLPATLTDDMVVIVHTTNRGVVLGVEVKGQDIIGTEALVHLSDFMVPVSIDSDPDGSTVIHVHADDVDMYQCDTHVLKKKSICDIFVGTFALDDLVYFTPDP